MIDCLTGTQNHEGIAGVLGALEYLAWVGETFGGVYAEKYARRGGSDVLDSSAGKSVDPPLLEVLEETPGVTVYGPRNVLKLEERVPTFSFSVRSMHSRKVAEKLDQAGIYVWDGKTYALAVTERLGLEESGGMVRVGAVHAAMLTTRLRRSKGLGRRLWGL